MKTTSWVQKQLKFSWEESTYYLINGQRYLKIMRNIWLIEINSALIYTWINYILLKWKLFMTLPNIYIYIYFKHNRHFLSTYFIIYPFILPYWFYNIRWGLVDVSPIIIYFPSTFCPTLGHHHERIYYKSDVTFVCTLLLCKKSVCTIAVCSIYI